MDKLNKKCEVHVLTELGWESYYKSAKCLEQNEAFVKLAPYIKSAGGYDEYCESWSDIRFWLQLAQHMGYGDYFPWKGETELFDYILKPMDLSTKYLIEEKPEGIVFGTYNCKEYEEKGFPTRSGKLEIYSEALEEMGYDPLPVFREPIEGPANQGLFSEYPLILTTGARLLEFYHSQFRNVQSLSKRRPEATAQINPASAKRYGVEDHDLIMVETQRGRIQIRAEVTEEIIPGVVSISTGWTESNVNMLTDETPYDPVLGYPSLKCQLCRIKKYNREDAGSSFPR